MKNPNTQKKCNPKTDVEPIYVISDIHGYLKPFVKALLSIDPFNGRLILLGDYLGGPDDYAILDLIARYLREGAKITVLRGNREQPYCPSAEWIFRSSFENRYGHGTEWHPHSLLMIMRKYEEVTTLTDCEDKGVIFVHAGIDEKAGENWRLDTDDRTFVEKYPPTFGKFSQTIVAGHVETAEIRQNNNHHIFWDGESHYYINGSVEKTGILPVLVIEGNKFYEIYNGRKYRIKAEIPMIKP